MGISRLQSDARTVSRSYFSLHSGHRSYFLLLLEFTALFRPLASVPHLVARNRSSPTLQAK